MKAWLGGRAFCIFDLTEPSIEISGYPIAKVSWPLGSGGAFYCNS